MVARMVCVILVSLMGTPVQLQGPPLQSVALVFVRGMEFAECLSVIMMLTARLLNG